MLLVFPSFSTSSGFAFAAEREFFHPFSRSGFGIRRSPFCCRSIFRLPLESSAPGACRFVSSCCGWCSSALSHLTLPVDFLLGNLVYSAPSFHQIFRQVIVSFLPPRSQLWIFGLRSRGLTLVCSGFPRLPGSILAASDFCFQSRTPDPALRCSSPSICFSLFSCLSVSLRVDFCRDLVSSV
jgi:hypothetical protein